METNNLYTKNFTWKVDNVLSLPELNGQYRQSEIFSSFGPIGQQQVKWCLRLYPRGEDSDSKKFISIFLHLLEGNGSEEVRANCKFSIVNERGTKLNKQETTFCVHTLQEDTDYNGWGFHKFIGREILATNNNYIVNGHQMIVDCQIEIKKDKQLIKARNEKRRLKIKIAELEQKVKEKNDEFFKERRENSKLMRENEKLQEKYDKLASKVRQNCKEMLEESAIEDQREEINNSPIKIHTFSDNETLHPSTSTANNIPSSSGIQVAPMKRIYTNKSVEDNAPKKSRPSFFDEFFRKM